MVSGMTAQSLAEQDTLSCNAIALVEHSTDNIVDDDTEDTRPRVESFGTGLIAVEPQLMPARRRWGDITRHDPSCNPSGGDILRRNRYHPQWRTRGLREDVTQVRHHARRSPVG